MFDSRSMNIPMKIWFTIICCIHPLIRVLRIWCPIQLPQPHPIPNINSLRLRPNRRHFADDIFKCIFENENEWISPRISLKFVPKVRINNIPAVVQIMAWRRPGDKPLSEPMMVSLLTHICVTQPQWTKWPLLWLTTWWNAFSWMKMIKFPFEFHCSKESNWQ